MARKQRRNVHVVPAGRGGFIARLARGRPLFRCPMIQRDAIEVAIREAKARGSEVVIHRPDGRIRDKDSYGRDPASVRDMKH